MKNLYYLLTFITIALNSNAQAPSIKFWDHRYGGDNFEFPGTLIQTLDKGFLVCGNSLSPASFNKSESCQGGLDYWIVKTDDGGNIIWDKTFGGSETENLTSALALPDSGFLIGGYSSSGISGDKSQPNQNQVIISDDFWVIRVDKNGNKIWDRTFGGDKKDQLNSMLILPDGTYLLGGTTFSNHTGDMSHNSYGDNDNWIINIDDNGNKLWDKNYGGNLDDKLIAMSLTSDNSLILAGYSNSYAGVCKSQTSCNNSYDFWILKTDLTGNIIWDKSYGGTSKDQFFCMTTLPGDKLIFGGMSHPGLGCEKSVQNWGSLGYTDFWLVCTDKDGNKLWDRNYGGDRNEDDFNSMTVINDGIMISGTSYSYITGDKTEANVLNSEQQWIIAIDTLGNKLWDKTIDNPTHVEYCSGLQTDDGCYVFLAHAGTNGGNVSEMRNSGEDFWLSKFCSNNLPPLANYSASTTSVCQNSCINFFNQSQNSTNYQWFFPGGTPSSDTSQDPQGICYFNTGNYDVTLIASGTNGTDTLSLPGFITVNTPLPFSSLTRNGDTLFATNGFTTYSWYRNSVLISGSTNSYLVMTQGGTYSVIVTDMNGCQSGATMVDVIAHTNDFIKPENYFLTTYNSGFLNLTVNATVASVVTIKVTDTLGKIILVKQVFLKTGTNYFEIPFESAGAGIYHITLQNSAIMMSNKVFCR